MYLNLVFGAILMACTAFLFTNGLWGNALLFINALLASLVALNFFEPLADWASGQAPEYRYLLDFVCLWAIFAVSMALLRAATDKISKVNLRFKMPIERIGNVAMALGVAWVMICFTAVTLHTAPLGKTFFGGSFDARKATFLGVPTEVMLLGEMQSASTGSLSRWTPNKFDPGNLYISKYGERREKFEGFLESTVPEGAGD